MSLNLFLAPGTVPYATALPGNAQALINMVCQYAGIDGTDGFSGLNYGPLTPSPDNRAYPWFKTDVDGNPIGLFSWNGSDWVPIPSAVAFGTTAQRPLNPATGAKFFDTTINVELIYYNGAWSTAAGSPGDLKFVDAVTIDAALLKNPGWTQFDAATCRVLGAAGTTGGLTTRAAGSTVGEETHVLQINEIPSHSHTTSLANANADGNDFNVDEGLSGHHAPGSAGSTAIDSSAVGGDAAHNNMQPTYFAWLLRKS